MATWEWRKHDQPTVLAALGRGEYEAIATSALGPLDRLGHLAAELGIFTAATETIKINRARDGIPDDLLLRSLVMLPFIDATSFADASGQMFADAALLLQLGYTAIEIREGFNDRYRNGLGQKSAEALPLHPAVLREEMQRIDVPSLDVFRQRCLQPLFEHRFVRGTTYAIDGTGLNDKWRVVALLNVTKGRNVLVSWRLLAGDASEKGKEATVVRSMIDDVLLVAGPDAIRLLLMDALYADGPLLATLKYQYGIDSLVRVPEHRDIFVDMVGIMQHEPARWQRHQDVRYLSGQKQMRTVAAAAVDGLTTFDSFRETARDLGAPDAALWGCLIHEVDASVRPMPEVWGLISTHGFSTAWQGYTTWRQRWQIENTAFHELKEAWHLEKARWGRSLPTIATRVTLTCVAFNVAQIIKGKDGRNLLDHGLLRLRRALTREVGIAPVIVYADSCYAILDIEDVMTAIGCPPGDSLRRTARPIGNRHPPLS
jgi:hypothetical protein